MAGKFENLREHILSLSNSTSFIDAKEEWELVGVAIMKARDSCPCGQAIKELCYINNKFNGNSTYVGNVCINKFIKIPTGNLFNGLKRIAKDCTASANNDVIFWAYKFSYINKWEYDFLSNIRGRRNLSDKQLEKKEKINIKIIERAVVRGKRAS